MKFLLSLLLGVIVGGAVVYFLFVGAPRTHSMPGNPVSAPDPNGDPPGTAVLVLNEQFFNTLLGTIFRELGEPTFRLGSYSMPTYAGAQDARFLYAQGGCQNQVVIAPEGGGVQTGVRLNEGRMLAPLAFQGSYSLLGNCMNFRGTGQANIELRFSAEDQALYGQLNMEGVNLEGFSPLLSGPVTAVVQNALNQRVNPLVLLRGSQLNLAVPVQATGGTLRGQAKDVRSEVKDGALHLHVTYNFSGTKGNTPPS